MKKKVRCYHYFSVLILSYLMSVFFLMVFGLHVGNWGSSHPIFRSVLLQREGKALPGASLPFHRAVPSLTHMALVELEKAGILKFVISQVGSFYFYFTHILTSYKYMEILAFLSNLLHIIICSIFFLAIFSLVPWQSNFNKLFMFSVKVFVLWQQN